MEGLTEKQQELENLCTEQAAKIEQLTRLVNQFSVSLLCLLKLGSAHMVKQVWLLLFLLQVEQNKQQTVNENQVCCCSLLCDLSIFENI